MRKEKSCGAIVWRKVENDIEILLIKHVNGGHWAFPKGHVEKNESEVQTATREILEETGLNATIDQNFREVVTFSPKTNVMKDVVYFSAQVNDIVPVAQAEEVQKIIWEKSEKALDVVTFKNDKILLEKLLKYLSK